ncbi:MAG: hypothetical protein Ct9H300mP8_00750 [Gammaproteobacteria bacterium]|nr:MAG: hypothetical protein Ct9H300mP8_00750 [Gammaproteobacteria bacterium]
MIQPILDKALAGTIPSEAEALALADFTDTKTIASVASILRDQGFHNVVTYSKKVFIPLTHLCRDVCHYCTFAQTPKKLDHPFMEIPQVLDVAKRVRISGAKKLSSRSAKSPSCGTVSRASGSTNEAINPRWTTLPMRLARFMRKRDYCPTLTRVTCPPTKSKRCGPCLLQWASCLSLLRNA